ncbi:MerR family transcriptional regulator [Agrococcus sediminis]|uniref:MerR family transcriptional regulator n=1 Tax=Agrococcus sediminis TaxID=2599924 RepID=A0A5M8QM25_9MICO|nr:MerR family transcriptional regulator [Agrococcus sediminis]KAA6436298.1 MerR family transcriptional regulator [Agrococcus sediminis]
MTDETMHIGELAERTGLSLRSLRHWDEVGLVRASGRTEGGFRLYTADDEERVRLIMRMKPFGFTLDEMAELARALDASPDAPLDGMPEDRAEYFRSESRKRRAKLARELMAADQFIERIEPVNREARDRGQPHTR